MVKCSRDCRCYMLCRVQGCCDLDHLSYIAHQHQGFTGGSLPADAAKTRAADQKMQELIAAEEKPQAKKKSKKKKVRHSCHGSVIMHFLALLYAPHTCHVDYFDHHETASPDEALIMMGRPLACRLLSNPRRSNSRQSCSRRHRSSKKKRRQLLLRLLLLLLLLLLLTMMMMPTMTNRSRYVLYTVYLNNHSLILSDCSFMCLHNSSSDLL